MNKSLRLFLAIMSVLVLANDMRAQDPEFTQF